MNQPQTPKEFAAHYHISVPTFKKWIKDIPYFKMWYHLNPEKRKMKFTPKEIKIIQENLD